MIKTTGQKNIGSNNTLILRRSFQQCKRILADWSLSKLAKQTNKQTNAEGSI